MKRMIKISNHKLCKNVDVEILGQSEKKQLRKKLNLSIKALGSKVLCLKNISWIGYKWTWSLLSKDIKSTGY